MVAGHRHMTVAGASIEIQDKAKPLGNPWNLSAETVDPMPETLAERFNVLNSKMFIFNSPVFRYGSSYRKILQNPCKCEIADLSQIVQNDDSMKLIVR
jgi:hypothetical protein